MQQARCYKENVNIFQTDTLGGLEAGQPYVDRSRITPILSSDIETAPSSVLAPSNVNNSLVTLL